MMSSFAPSANLTAMAIPDFIAGFIYGMTGDNHLEEIEGCFDAGQDLVTDAQEAVAELKAGHLISGLGKVGEALEQLESSVDTCQGMDDDIAAIKEWAVIFKDPAKLAKVAGKNWLFHGVEIKKDLAEEQDDWAAGNWFDAGEDTADALVTLLGPIESAM